MKLQEMRPIGRWKLVPKLLIVAALMVTLSEAITVGGAYRKQHQTSTHHVKPGNGARWHHHHQHHHNAHHRAGVSGPTTRVHRSGTSANHYQQQAATIAGAARFRGPVKRVYLPYKYLPPQFQHKMRYSVGAPGPIHAKRQAINAPPPGWKPKRYLHMGPPSLHVHNNYMPPRKNKHPVKYQPNGGKLSQNSAAASVITDSYGAPYKVTSTTYGVPHPTQGAPEPPTSNAVTSAKEVPTSFVQVYHGNNRDVETKTSYSFNTQHQLSPANGISSQKLHYQHGANQQHQALTRPLKTKANHLLSVTPSPQNYYLESSSTNEHPVHRPAVANSNNHNNNNNTTNGKAHHKLSAKESSQSSASSYGGFQPPKQTYGFQPYDEKESSVVNIGSLASDSYYSGSSSSVTNSQTASTASLSPSSSSTTNQAREEYLSPNYFQQKS